MDRRELKTFKAVPERRLAACEFAPIKRKLPKPLDKLSGVRLKTTGMLDVGGGAQLVFIWKSGVVREQRSLYGWMFRQTDRGLDPVARLDYHPSHKNLHAVINCERGLDLTNRGLPGCKEFLFADIELDPDSPTDRNRFIEVFCKRFNVQLGYGDLL